MSQPATPTTGAALAAQGIMIPLRGRELPLRFSFMALHIIEQHFGSIDAMRAALNSEEGGQVAVFGRIGRVLHAGLEEHYTPGEDGYRACLRDLEPRHLGTYSDALVKALGEAFGPNLGDGQGNDPAPADPAPATEPSPGPSGGTSPSSLPESDPVSSGA